MWASGLLRQWTKKNHKQSCAVERSGCSWAEVTIWHLEIVFEFLTEVLSHWVQICRVLMKIVCLTNMSANNQRTWKAKSLMSSAPKHIEILMICSDALSVGKLQQFDDTCLQTRQVQKRFHLSMTLPKNTSLISEPSSHHWVLKNMKQQSPKDWNMTWTVKNNKEEGNQNEKVMQRSFQTFCLPPFTTKRNDRFPTLSNLTPATASEAEKIHAEWWQNACCC